MLQVKYNATVKQKNAEIQQLKKELTILNQTFNEKRK